MSAGTITFKAGRREREDDYKDFAGQDGVYNMTLVSVSEPYTAPSTFHKSGQQTFRDWLFAVSDGGAHDGEVLDMRSTVSTSDKSKQFEIVTALIGRNPALGSDIDIDKHLVGRDVMAHIQTNDNNFPFIASLMPAPAKGAKPAAAPASPPEAAQDGDALPF